jgi:hypothetical protein
MPSPAPDIEHQISATDFANYTDEQRKAVLEYKEASTQWNSCIGGSTDSRLLKYIVIHFIIIALIIWTMVMLSHTTDCEGSQLHSSMLTFLIGLVIPTGK